MKANSLIYINDENYESAQNELKKNDVEAVLVYRIPGFSVFG